MYLKAKQLENDLLINEHESLIKLINAKTGNKDMQKYMLNKLRSLSMSNNFGDRKDSSFEPSAVLNALVANNLENAINDKHAEGLDSTQFLMDRIRSNEHAIDNVQRHNITVFDEHDPAKRRYQPANAADSADHGIEVEEILTYK